MTIQEIKKNGWLLFECISGSKAYGLDTPTSDTDLKGVFYLPEDIYYGLKYIPQVSNDTNDEVYYELGRFIELLAKNNPNILEMLASPTECILYKNPVMNHISSGLFLSRLCKETFAGYAHSQIKKARGYKKKIVNPMEKERKDVLDFCYILTGSSSLPLKSWLSEKGIVQEQCGLSSIPHAKDMYALFYDRDNTKGYHGIVNNPVSNEVNLSPIEKEGQLIAYLSFNKEAYSQYCKEYKEYWEWVDKRNKERYNTNQQHGKNYDAKNMMHTIRLLQVAEEIVRDGVLNVKRPNREELLKIKQGKMEYDQLLLLADQLMQSIDEYTKISNLPDEPDMELINRLLVKMRKELFNNKK
ncbi:MAG: nucleotidyltransferase domain-containing protein [Tannerellaceae bacterium]|nr:nucleotidyltransferase domain-containing protein [Tannerellaceae bacterium]